MALWGDLAVLLRSSEDKNKKIYAVKNYITNFQLDNKVTVNDLLVADLIDLIAVSNELKAVSEVSDLLDVLVLKYFFLILDSDMSSCGFTDYLMAAYPEHLPLSFIRPVISSSTQILNGKSCAAAFDIYLIILAAILKNSALYSSHLLFGNVLMDKLYEFYMENSKNSAIQKYFSNFMSSVCELIISIFSEFTNEPSKVKKEFLLHISRCIPIEAIAQNNIFLLRHNILKFLNEFLTSSSEFCRISALQLLLVSVQVCKGDFDGSLSFLDDLISFCEKIFLDSGSNSSFDYEKKLLLQLVCSLTLGKSTEDLKALSDKHILKSIYSSCIQLCSSEKNEDDDKKREISYLLLSSLSKFNPSLIGLVLGIDHIKQVLTDINKQNERLASAAADVLAVALESVEIRKMLSDPSYCSLIFKTLMSKFSTSLTLIKEKKTIDCENIPFSLAGVRLTASVAMLSVQSSSVRSKFMPELVDLIKVGVKLLKSNLNFNNEEERLTDNVQNSVLPQLCTTDSSDTFDITLEFVKAVSILSLLATFKKVLLQSLEKDTTFLSDFIEILQFRKFKSTSNISSLEAFGVCFLYHFVASSDNKLCSDQSNLSADIAHADPSELEKLKKMAQPKDENAPEEDITDSALALKMKEIAMKTKGFCQVIVGIATQNRNLYSKIVKDGEHQSSWRYQMSIETLFILSSSVPYHLDLIKSGTINACLQLIDFFSKSLSDQEKIFPEDSDNSSSLAKGRSLSSQLIERSRQIISRLLIRIDCSQFPENTQFAMISNLLGQIVHARHELAQFEACLALHNLTAVNDSCRTFALRKRAWSIFRDLIFESNYRLVRVGLQGLSNLSAAEDGNLIYPRSRNNNVSDCEMEKNKLNKAAISSDLKMFLSFLPSDGLFFSKKQLSETWGGSKDEAVSSVNAAAGALACLTYDDDVVVVFAELLKDEKLGKGFISKLRWLLSNDAENCSDFIARGRCILENLVNSPQVILPNSIAQEIQTVLKQIS